MFVDQGSGMAKERFSFPDLKEGSVIEYIYTIYSGSVFNLHSWDFQGEYPHLLSIYSVTFPAVFNYVITYQGSLTGKRTDYSGNAQMSVGNYTIRAPNFTSQWQVKDVPAFKEEPFISAPGNYVDGIRFQLSEYTDLRTGRRKKNLDSWARLNEALYKAKAFGGIMTTSSHWLRKELKTIVGDSINEMDKARVLFTYVRDHFISTGRSVFSDEDVSLRDIFKARKGSVAEINLLLTAMLRESDVVADAVILSTRDNGYINPTLSIVENFNYVVVRCKIGGKAYFLDASEPRLGLLYLPENQGQSR